MFPELCGENMWYRYATGGRVSPDIYSLCFDQFQVSALTVTHYLKLLRRFLVFFILHYSQQLLLALGVTLTPYSQSLFVSPVCGTRALVWLTLKLCKLGYLCCDLWSLLNFLYPRHYLKILDHRQDGLPVCFFFIELYFTWNFLGAEKGYFSWDYSLLVLLLSMLLMHTTFIKGSFGLFSYFERNVFLLWVWSWYKKVLKPYSGLNAFGRFFLHKSCRFFLLFYEVISNFDSFDCF